MADHLAGRTISSYTYLRYGCRCDGCRQAQTIIRRQALNARRWLGPIGHGRRRDTILRCCCTHDAGQPMTLDEYRAAHP